MPKRSFRETTEEQKTIAKFYKQKQTIELQDWTYKIRLQKNQKEQGTRVQV